MKQDKFIDVLNKMKEIIGSKRVMLCCSTGVDSMVLFDLLMKATSFDNIIITHVNHKKRTQSDLEEQFIEDFCLDKNIKCYTYQLEHYEGNNFQEWAREKRYDFFKEIAEKENVDIILLAHHSDDNLETILMRLIRSSSLAGYAGIKEFSFSNKVMFYRPLINVSKEDIYKYASINKIKYFEDASNQTDDYLRNRIRHHIIPVFKQENPNLEKAISNYSQTLFEANELIEKEEKNFIKSIDYVYNNNEFFVKFEISKFKQLNDFLQLQVLFRILKPFSFSKDLILELLSYINGTKSRIITKISDKIEFIKEYNTITMTNSNTDDLEFCLKIIKDGVYDIPYERKVIIEKYICSFQATKVNLWYNINDFPIFIRNRKPNDRIRLKNGTKSVNDFLTDKKVPYLERKKVLLLCDSNNEPIAVLGFRKTGGK